MMQTWVVLTGDQKDGLKAYDTPDVMLGARAVDHPQPGLGTNVNPDAADHVMGAAVPLAGMWIVPQHMIDDHDYAVRAPLMVDGLRHKPFCTLESDAVFAPVTLPA